ncbi:MAG: hypothetical protein IPK03_05555 [Bacteroidetes bacterium]|nr:hypothetical protein [Bacteroidota bacterium]
MDVRKLENYHIPLWLIKDTCWLLHFKTLGIVMIIPTISVAVIIAFRTRQVVEFWLNLSVVFWIFANAFWMLTEFLEIDADYKVYALVPFILGVISSGYIFLNRNNIVFLEY